MMGEERVLIEHFFRHEYGRLVSILTRWLGIRNLGLAEDVVQAAMSKALQSWSQRGLPEDPSAWLYRTARNLAIDQLRREAALRRQSSRLAETQLLHSSLRSSLPNAEFEGSLQDSPLRLLFLCCHASIPLASQLALALKLVAGFGVREIANALLANPASVEKRIARAKETLRDLGEEIADLKEEQMTSRLQAVLLVVYLLFNEGFAASAGTSLLKRELCDEAIRLVRMLIAHPLGNQPATQALLALMLMHSARFDARLDEQHCIVLLEAQDRAQWAWPLIHEAMHWMLESARGEDLSRYHIEAAINWEHCRAESVSRTDWHRVSELYDLLLRVAPSAMVRLNRAIALSYHLGLDVGLASLLGLTVEDRRMLRPWWDCAVAEVYHRMGNATIAKSHWQDALRLAATDAQRRWIAIKLQG